MNRKIDGQLVLFLLFCALVVIVALSENNRWTDFDQAQMERHLADSAPTRP
jgi:hypothetical protein